VQKITIRPYSSTDRDAIRFICCETGFSGKPVDPLFCDRNTFADFFTKYYTDWEPESSFVGEVDGQVVGYLNGCLRYHYHGFAEKCIIASLVPKVSWKIISGSYNQQSRAFLWWCIFQGSKQTPPVPKESAHFHFNILPEYHNTGIGLRLYRIFVEHLNKHKAKRVYAQLQTSENKRTLRLFNRFGFVVTERRHITKFKDFHDKKIYVSTIVREL